MRLVVSKVLLAAVVATAGCVTVPYAGPAGPDTRAVDPAPIPKGEPLGFVFFGDQGTGGPDQYRVARGVRTHCGTHACKFVTLLGDNFYTWGVKTVDDPQFVDKFEAVYKEIPLRFYTILGNHDYYGNIEAQIAYTQRSPKWVMPARYFRMEQGDVELFGLDTQNFDPPQLKWLDERLKASKATWKIVFGHHPIRSYGRHGDTSELVDDLLPLLEKRGVQFYLSGHEHDQQVLELGAITHVVSGGGGTSLRETSKGPQSVYARSTHGFGYLLIQGDLARLAMLDADGKPLYEKSVTASSKPSGSR